MSGVNPSKSTLAAGFRSSTPALPNFKHNVRKFTGRRWGVSIPYRLDRFARYVRGRMTYFGISDYYRPIREIDSWIRRRIRMCYWEITSTRGHLELPR